MHKTFEELERIAYIINLPKIAKLYAQLDDLEFQCNEQKVTLEKIADIINE